MKPVESDSESGENKTFRSYKTTKILASYDAAFPLQHLLRGYTNSTDDVRGKATFTEHTCSLPPASVAQLDARPTGDQEVAGSTPAEVATFFCGD